MKTLQRTSLMLMLALAGCQSSEHGAEMDAGTDAGDAALPPDEIPGPSTAGFGVDFADPKATYVGELLVVDAKGAALASRLSVDDKSIMADGNGRIRLPKLPVAKTLTGRVVADGYLPRVVTLSFASVGQRPKRIVMNEVSVLATLNASAGGNVSATSMHVDFPPNAFLGADGKPYTGKVVVAVGAHDPASLVLSDYQDGSDFALRSDFDFDRVPDGYLFAKQPDGSLGFQFPESTFSVDLTDADGNPLALDPNKPATFTMKLPPMTHRLPGDVVDVFTFDEEARQWVADGKCTVQSTASGLECVGEAKHFSARSMPADNQGNTYCEQIRVVRLGWPEGVTVEQWSESQHGTEWLKAEINELSERGMCHLSASSTARLRIIATTADGEKRVLTRASFPGSVKLDEAAQQTLETEHDCPTCTVHVIAADWADMAPLTDADDDGSFAGDESDDDCNDDDARVNPHAAETYCDSVDVNCDGKAGKGWKATTLAQAKQEGITAAEWNQTVCDLPCVVPDSSEVVGKAGDGWDENCDGNLECPIDTAADADGLCVPLKDCSDVSCGANATCVEVSAIAVECRCDSGFAGQNGTCTDIDECTTQNGGCAQNCNNSTGSFSCGCDEGYVLNADGKACDDVNECDTENGGCAQNCDNTAGSSTCGCDEGYVLNADGKACDDVDECAAEPSPCPKSQECHNTEGSHTCGCPAGTQDNDQNTTCLASCSGAPETCTGGALCDDSTGVIVCEELDCVADDFCDEACGDTDPDCTSDPCMADDFCNEGCGQTDPDCPVGPDCSSNGICNDVCGYSDPDCTSGPDCTADNICNDLCGSNDPDCPSGPNCTPDSFCNDLCGDLDPDCTSDTCVADDFCEEGCGETDPDCMVDPCMADTFCNEGCGDTDPDCTSGPDCSSNGICNDICGDLDPDCVMGGSCVQDAICDPECGPADPDCTMGGSCSFDAFCNFAMCGYMDPDCMQN